MTKNDLASQQEADRSKTVLLQAIYNRLQQVDQRLVNMENAMALQYDIFDKLRAQQEQQAIHRAESESEQPRTKEGFKATLAEVLERRARAIRDIELAARSRQLINAHAAKAVGNGFQVVKAAAMSLSQDVSTLIGDAFDSREIHESGVVEQNDLSQGPNVLWQRARDMVRERITEPLQRLLEEDDDDNLDRDGYQHEVVFDANMLISADSHAPPSLSPSIPECDIECSSESASAGSADFETMQCANRHLTHMIDVQAPESLSYGTRVARLRKKQQIIKAAQMRDEDYRLTMLQNMTDAITRGREE